MGFAHSGMIQAPVNCGVLILSTDIMLPIFFCTSLTQCFFYDVHFVFFRSESIWIRSPPPGREVPLYVSPAGVSPSPPRRLDIVYGPRGPGGGGVRSSHLTQTVSHALDPFPLFIGELSLPRGVVKRLWSLVKTIGRT